MIRPTTMRFLRSGPALLLAALACGACKPAPQAPAAAPAPAPPAAAAAPTPAPAAEAPTAATPPVREQPPAAPRAFNGEEECVRGWSMVRELNEFGDKVGTVYAGGTPLFDEKTGQQRSFLDYFYSKHPEVRSSCAGKK